MKDSIQRDLTRIERRESHLWFLVLSLLIVFGAVIAGPYTLNWLRQTGSDSGLSESTSSTTAAGLFFMVTLLCLYTLHTLLLNSRMKGLLGEMNRAAASSMALDDFLPSIAQKIATTSSANVCRIALFDVTRTTLRLASAYADGYGNPKADTGRAFAWDELPFCKKAAETLRPVNLRWRDIAHLPVGGQDLELLTGGLKRIHSILVVPMMTQDRLVGLVILGRSARVTAGRFNGSTVALAQALASHAAAAIDQAQLKREAIHDPLTNLYNRRHFSERLREEIYRADRHTHITAILLCDLDRFKAVNDTLGHQAGDRVLKAIAAEIQASTRETDLVFRWGGDEMVVILSETSRQGTVMAAERIRQAVRQATQVDIDVSIGIALYPEHGRDEDELIRTADRALYIAKKSGEHVRIGEEDYQMDRRTIKVVFQPVVDVTADRIVGYEALTRDPEGKLTAPQFFEKYRLVGRINELKQLTLKSQIVAAKELGMKRVFINVDFCVLSQIEPIEKPADVEVVLELSELEALHDLENHLTVTRRWRDQGYRFALDDFGAGFISLPFLAMLVPDYVKVDRSTILQAVSSATFRHFLDRLLGAVRTYAAEGIIAEGIEKAEELQLVKDLGISLVQGFMFGKPQELKLGAAPEALSESHAIIG
jgi:diguanylate cyclase (GGDEF)-like protein